MELKFKNKFLFANLQKFRGRGSGRGSMGNITMFHRGGGHKRCYRFINFKFLFFEIPGIVLELQKDPSRNCYTAIVWFSNGILTNILAVNGIMKGTKVYSSRNNEVYVGSFTCLNNIPTGNYVSSVELIPGLGAKFARAAGASIQVLRKIGKFTQLKLISGEIRVVNSFCIVAVGSVSYEEYKLNKFYKAGQSAWAGRLPIVRGVAKNPVDHPHGGGQGKTKGGRPSVSPWSRLTKGFPTRSRKKLNKFIIINRKNV
jgi:large subunit ribosomal protein L2